MKTTKGTLERCVFPVALIAPITAKPSIGSIPKSHKIKSGVRSPKAICSPSIPSAASQILAAPIAARSFLSSVRVVTSSSMTSMQTLLESNLARLSKAFPMSRPKPLDIYCHKNIGHLKGIELDGVSAEDIARMEREMERLNRDYRAVEGSLGDTMLALVVTRGYVSKLFRNEAISDFLDRHPPELAFEMRSIIDAVGGDARMLDR
ncbi:conserved protein of unknown function [Magnetospirillum gryphiswaldense MSR-1 v2]|uniref:RepB plasmid partition domain-containing protein n=2 Tax=Magnetospirillum gryphiswaldense TaxID=55518 RepID=V6F4U3_MAGGM|nr:conserved protein of unknown function [Magnetospirillum gryphiswaldense MSR-1 v2]